MLKPHQRSKNRNEKMRAIFYYQISKEGLIRAHMCIQGVSISAVSNS